MNPISQNIKVLKSQSLICIALLCSSLIACGGGSNTNINGQNTPIALSGKTSFVSADTGSGINTPYVNAGAMDDTKVSVSSANGARTVVEGDIYRVLDGGKTVLNLNPTRGLQIIDIQNPDAPKIVGRAPVDGTPVEMYAVGNRVYALLNEWTEYKPVLKAGQEVMDSFHGGAVITIDVSNRSAPKILSTQRIGGYIGSSRLTSGTNKNALYVAYQVYDGTNNNTAAKSFSVNASGDLVEKDMLTFPGYSNAMQVSNNTLLIASVDYSSNQFHSIVNIVDISSPDGSMIQGASVTPSGIVQQKNNLHVQGNILRVVSGTNWGNTTTSNHVETFNITDIKHPVAIDHAKFGEGQQLFGTTFMADKAFFVTYLRKDPFHAFSISADGKLHEENAYVVSGWNDFFTPVKSNTRLVGVGHNDENDSRALSISLYDVTNLQNKQPLVARADMDLNFSWSEANWDDRAFTVIDNATNVISADGKNTETGIVMLPYTGWDNTTQTYRSGVQLFSFSANSITRRGSMQQDSRVLRSTMASDNLALNLSDSQISLFGTANVNAPVARSSLPLVSNYSQFVAFSSIGARYNTSDDSWWGNNSAARHDDNIELVAINDVDKNAALSSIKVPKDSKIFNVNGNLVVFSSVADNGIYHSTISIYDISRPASPRLLGSVKTDEIKPAGGPNIYFRNMFCIRSGCGGYANFDAKVVGSSLLFSSQIYRLPPASDSTVPGSSFSNFSLTVVDLSNSSNPSVLPSITMENEAQAVNIIEAGNSVWINYKKPQANAANTNQALAKYYVRELNLSTPSNKKFGPEINIPGQLMNVSGNQLYTIEYTWKANDLVASLNKLTVQNDLAYLQASYDLATRYISSFVIDSGTVALSSYDTTNYEHRISLFTSSDRSFNLLSTIAIDDVGEVKLMRQGKLMLQNSYGIFLYDVTQPSRPSARAFFSARTWYGNISVFDNDIFLPANTYGIYQFNWNTVNLIKN